MGLKMEAICLRGVPFDFNAQEDLAEILRVVLDQLRGISLAASHLICKSQFPVMPAFVPLC